MPETQIHPVTEPGAWKVADFESLEDVSVELTADEIAELEAFNRRMDEAGKGLDDVEAAEFSCPKIKARMRVVREELENGRGFLIMSGLPWDRWSQEDLERAYWGMGTQLGVGLSQSVMGERLGHVRDFTKGDPKSDIKGDPHARAYRNSGELNPHTDYCDMLALFCLRGAKSGGVSLLTSALSVHNDLLADAPAALERLYEGFHYHRRGEERPGEAPVTPHKVPVFSDTGGHVSTRWLKPFVELGQEAIGQPLNDFDNEAINKLLASANSDALQLRFTLQPGQIMWVNNLTHLHARTEFEDGDDYENRRHLMRLWLNDKSFRPTSDNLKLYDGDDGIGYQEGKTPSYDEAAEKQRLRSGS